MLYLKDGTKLPNQKWYSATDEQVQAAIDARIADGTLAVGNGDEISADEIALAYIAPVYVEGTLATDGSINTSGHGVCTDFLPVAPGETLVLSNKLTVKVAYFDGAQNLISITTTTNGLNEYAVPQNASYARFQNVYNNGGVTPLGVRYKDAPQNRSFFDLVMSPIKTRPQIGFSGDSNTYGYGLSDIGNSWANLFAATLQGITKLSYTSDDRWTEGIGAHAYSTGFNFMQHSQFSIWTDAENLTLNIGASYSSTWEWYVDGELQSGKASETTIALDGNFHKVSVRFTAGQAVNPAFVITKNIGTENVAVSGMGYGNMPIPAGKDWLFVMIGTNDTGKDGFGFIRSYIQYAHKGTYIVPFPKHTSADTYSMAKTFGELIGYFKAYRYDILNVSDVAGVAFFDDTLFQSDLIHYSENGHRVMANIISGKLGLPTYFKAVD